MFSSKKSIKIEKQLFALLTEVAERTGYSSTDELIRHVLEREVAAVDQESDQQQAEDQLRGLGYIE
jgi:metal-responsive CopG/Arc/MetJ family transcriptional regulator